MFFLWIQYKYLDKDIVQLKDNYDNGDIIYNNMLKCPHCKSSIAISYTYIGEDGIEHKEM